MDEGTVVSKVGGRLKQLFRCSFPLHSLASSITRRCQVFRVDISGSWPCSFCLPPLRRAQRSSSEDTQHIEGLPES